MKEGESGSDLYVVVSGRLRAEQAGTVIGEVNAGEYFGEAALLTDDRRQATVWTTLPVHEFSLLNWKAAADLIEIGYRHAMDNMDEWTRLLLE